LRRIGSGTGGSGRAGWPRRRRAVIFRRFHPAHAHRHLALRAHAELVRRAARQVDDPRTADERPAIVDPHDDPAAAIKRGNFHVARQRQRGMRGGDPAGNERFPVGGAVARFTAIPTGIAEHIIGGAGGGHVSLPTHGIGRTDPHRRIADRTETATTAARAAGQRQQKRHCPTDIRPKPHHTFLTCRSRPGHSGPLRRGGISRLCSVTDCALHTADGYT
jgi:hypothetical protein